MVIPSGQVVRRGVAYIKGFVSFCRFIFSTLVTSIPRIKHYASTVSIISILSLWQNFALGSSNFHCKIPNLWFMPFKVGRHVHPPHPPVLDMGYRYTTSFTRE